MPTCSRSSAFFIQSIEDIPTASGQTGRTDRFYLHASLRRPGDLAKSSQQVLRQCRSLNRTTDPGQVSSHSPVRIGSIDVTVVRRPRLNGSPAGLYRHVEAESATGWQHPINASLGCQASVRRLGLDDSFSTIIRPPQKGEPLQKIHASGSPMLYEYITVYFRSERKHCAREQ